MAVKHRVKPSVRMMAAIRERQKKIFIGIIIALILGTTATATLFYYNSYHGKEDTLITDAVATRTMLSSRTTYSGTWVEGPRQLFEVYLPGDTVDSEKFNSSPVTASRDVDYDNSLLEVYGVYTGTEQLDIQVSDDTMTLTKMIMPLIIEDVGTACYGRGASGAYDVETVYMTDGRLALRISGDVEMVLLKQYKDDPENTMQETAVYPVIAYITLEKGYPVVVWGSWNSEDAAVSLTASDKIEQCANTLWQREYLGEDSDWTPFKVITDQDQVNIYDGDEEPDYLTVESSDPDADENLGEPKPYTGQQDDELKGEEENG